MRQRLVGIAEQSNMPGPDKYEFLIKRYYPIIQSSEKSTTIKGMHKDFKRGKTPGPVIWF
jgi:hypothetical protein